MKKLFYAGSLVIVYVCYTKRGVKITDVITLSKIQLTTNSVILFLFATSNTEQLQSSMLQLVLFLIIVFTAIGSAADRHNNICLRSTATITFDMVSIN